MYFHFPSDFRDFDKMAATVQLNDTRILRETL